MKAKTFWQLYKEYEDIIEELAMNPDLITHYDSERTKEFYQPSFISKIKRFYNRKYIIHIADKERMQ